MASVSGSERPPPPVGWTSRRWDSFPRASLQAPFSDILRVTSFPSVMYFSLRTVCGVDFCSDRMWREVRAPTPGLCLVLPLPPAGGPHPGGDHILGGPHPEGTASSWGDCILGGPHPGGIRPPDAWGVATVYHPCYSDPPPSLEAGHGRRNSSGGLVGFR